MSPMSVGDCARHDAFCNLIFVRRKLTGVVEVDDSLCGANQKGMICGPKGVLLSAIQPICSMPDAFKNILKHI